MDEYARNAVVEREQTIVGRAPGGELTAPTLEAALGAYLHERPWLRLLRDDDLVLAGQDTALD